MLIFFSSLLCCKMLLRHCHGKFMLRTDAWLGGLLRGYKGIRGMHELWELLKLLVGSLKKFNCQQKFEAFFLFQQLSI